MAELADPIVDGTIEAWQENRFRIDTRDTHDMVRLYISFVGTLLVLFGIICCLAVQTLYPALSIPIPMSVFVYDTIIIMIWYTIFAWMANDYEDSQDEHCNMLERKITFRMEHNLETGTYRQAQNIIRSKMGVLNANIGALNGPVVPLAQKVIGTIFTMSLQSLLAIAIFKNKD